MRLVPRSRKRRVAVVVALLSYTLLMTLGGCADFFILYPTTDKYVVAGTTRREVPVAGGKSVEVWTMRSEGARSREPEAYVLEFVGNASRAEGMAEFVAEEWGRLTAIRSVSVIDTLLAATARVHGLTLATRNIRDVAWTGVASVDPFAPPRD